MSNRTNQTLSATTNRLNFGSRSLVLPTGQNDKATLNFRRATSTGSHPGIIARWDRMMIMQPQSPIMAPACQPSFTKDSKRGTTDCGGRSSFDLASGSTSWLVYSWREQVKSSLQGCLSLEAPPVHNPVVSPDVPRTVREVSRPRTLRSTAQSGLFIPERATERASLGTQRLARSTAALAPAAAS